MKYAPNSKQLNSTHYFINIRKRIIDESSEFMGIFSYLRSVFGIINDLFEFLWKKKLWWLIPFVIVLLVFAILFILASITPLGPFIYALF